MKHDYQNDTPIFITGSVRSGTSIITRALIHGAGIQGYTEGCFIQFAGGFRLMVDRDFARRGAQMHDPRIMISGVQKDKFIESYRAWFLEEYYTWSVFTGRWVDKTADVFMVHGVPEIEVMWPKSKCIFMKRRPIENLISRLRKFPERNFRRHCEQWRNVMEAWEKSRERIQNKDFYIEIDQYDIAIKPDEVAEEVGRFLDLHEQQIIAMKKTFKTDRPEFTGGNESVVKSLEELPWTDEQKEIFMELCGPLSERFGYSLGKSYYA